MTMPSAFLAVGLAARCAHRAGASSAAGEGPFVRDSIAAAVLAAGASSRMGEQKLLLPLGGTSIVRRVVERVRAAAVDDVLVVLGRDAEAVRAELAGTGSRFVVNPNYADGMGTSFRTAVDAFDSVSAALFALADQPFVTTDMLDVLLATYRRTEPLAVISRFGGVIAPPHVFARELFAGLGLPGSEGAKALLRAHSERCVVVDLPEEGLTDVDDPESYRHALELTAREQRTGHGS
jgi:molybdenum cofactor cytidylyltransferase